MKSISNKSWYSIVIVLMIIGFLMILTVWVFNLVLREMNDNRGMGNAIKAFAGAEAWQELALLQIKKNGYWYYDKVVVWDLDSELLHNGTNSNKNVDIMYDIASKVNRYEGTIEAWKYNIIPLFYRDSNRSTEYKVVSIDLNIAINGRDNVTWNIISKTSGISWVWNNINWHSKTVDPSSWNLIYSTQTIDSFLTLGSNENNYLVLFNSNAFETTYILEATNSWEFFTKPDTDIISSAKIGGYKQNLKTNLDNTEFLNILKYSIFSN